MIRLLVLLLLAGCVSPAPKPADPPPASSPQVADATIYVLVHEWHTEVSIPARRVTGGLTRLHSIFPGASYFSFGFGERLYMQKVKTDTLDMLTAILPGPGALLTTALVGSPAEMYTNVEMVPIKVTQAELDRLADFLWDSFEKAPDGALNRLGEGAFPGYVFYGAAPTYSGFYTCNTWTIDALDKAGLDADPAGVLLASQAMVRARMIASRAGR
ncbi:MAG: DUF2459 domain-containing protein [Alphaproteobacteria bacterium]|nr:DUF2459 domain-containing protein [Alphaproteobacteria bacterium]